VILAQVFQQVRALITTPRPGPDALRMLSVLALLLCIAFSVPVFAQQVTVVGVQTQIAATGISYSGSNTCETYNTSNVPTNGEWCGPVGIATDSSGNIYVAQYTASQIVKLDASTHTPTVLLGHGSGASGVNNPQQMAMDSNNNLYIADPGNSNRVVQYSTTSNTITATYPVGAYPFAVGVDSSNNVWIGASNKLYEVPANTASGTSATLFTTISTATNIWGIAFDSSGNMWVADNPDPNVSNQQTGNIFEFTAASSFSTMNTVFTSSTLYGPGQIVFDSSNNMYVSEDNINSVVKFNYSSSYTYGYSASDSYAVSSSVPSAEAVARDSNNNLFLTAYGSGLQSDSEVVEISSAAGTFPNQAVGSTSSTNVTVNLYVDSGATIGSFAVLDQGTSGLEFSRVTDSSTDCTATTYGSATTCSIQASFTPTAPGLHDGAIEVLDGSGNKLATAYINGTGTGPLAAFSPLAQSTVTSGSTVLYGVFVDNAGNVYVANTGGNSVLKYPVSGSSYGSPVTITTDTSSPRSVAVDGAGNVYVGDYGNNRVDLIPWNGSSYGTQTTVGSSLNSPTGVAVDGSGNVYVADYGNNQIAKFPWNSSTGAFGTQSSISVTNPTGIAVDGSGNLFVAEYTTAAVVEFPVSGSGYGSAVSLGSGWVGPYNLSVDTNDNVYVADLGAGAIYQVPWNGSSYGSATVVANTGLSAPTDVSVNGSGNIYVADAGNDRILELSNSTSASITFPTSTAVGSEDSTDGGLTATLLNLGNTTLDITSSSFPTGFSEASSTTCTLNSGTLSSNSSCTIAVDFTPETVGTNSGDLVITDNSLNVSGSTQDIALSGTGLADVSQLAFTTAPATQITAGSSEGTIVVAEENSSGATVTTATDNITLTVTGPNGYSATYTGTAASGVATYTGVTAPTVAGTYTYTATDSSSSSVTAATVTQTVTAAAAASVSVSQGSSQTAVIGSQFGKQLQVTVTDAYNNLVSGATVTFTGPSSGASSSFSPSSSATSNSSGIAAVTATANGYVGSYNVTASVSGASTSATFSMTNSQATPTVSLTSASNPAWINSSVTYSATVTGVSGGATPTGLVSFYDGTTLLGTASPNSSGVASISAAPATSGTHSISATIASDANYTTATSLTVSEVAVDFTVAVVSGDSSSASVQPGNTATYNLVVTPVGASTFPGAITLTQSGAPSSSTTTLSPSSIASGLAATNVTLTVQTSTALVLNRGESVGRKLAPLSLALLIIPFAGFRRGRKAWQQFLMALVLLAGGLAVTASLSGCSTSSGYFGQEPDTFTITVTGTPGTLTHSTSVTLTIE
jgi:sugar lactone lactonase YvrE